MDCLRRLADILDHLGDVALEANDLPAARRSYRRACRSRKVSLNATLMIRRQSLAWLPATTPLRGSPRRKETLRLRWHWSRKRYRAFERADGSGATICPAGRSIWPGASRNRCRGTWLLVDTPLPERLASLPSEWIDAWSGRVSHVRLRASPRYVRCLRKFATTSHRRRRWFHEGP